MSVNTNYPAGCGPATGEPGSVNKTGGKEGSAPRILIIDDDKGLLESYRVLLGGLPSRPEIHIASSSSRALALLESQSFVLLITDLRMPKIDGFQVLMSVRRKYPELRTVVLTGLADEQYRVRAYSMGIDLYAEKPTSAGDLQFFAQCIESLLSRGSRGGFRGIQNKSLMDLIQHECLSQNSCVLRITNGALDARIWIERGEVIDAETGDAAGEEAFKNIFGWKSGNFEVLPGDPSRERVILTSFQALLLDTAQLLDESVAVNEIQEGGLRPSAALAPLLRTPGVESLLVTGSDKALDSWGVENAAGFAEWTQRLMAESRALGHALQTGALKTVEALGPRRHLVILSNNETHLLAGLDRALSPGEVRETVKQLSARWEA